MRFYAAPSGSVYYLWRQTDKSLFRAIAVRIIDGSHLVNKKGLKDPLLVNYQGPSWPEPGAVLRRLLRR